MRLTAILFFLNILWTTASAQYFLTGEVLDEHGDKLQQVAVLVRSSGFVYRTGLNGDFSIRSRNADDSLTIWTDGYEPYTTAIQSSGFLQVMLRPRSMPVVTSFPLLSQTNGMSVSFAGESDGVSYHMIRRFLDQDVVVPAEAVRIEQLLSYFNSTYEEPDSQKLFHFSSRLLSCPWNGAHQLLCLNVCVRKADLNKTPPGNLVFLVDASGSMDMPNKMPLLKAGFRMLVRNLRDNDTVSVVIFGGRTGVLVQGMPGSRKADMVAAMERLQPDGPTPGLVGVKLAYQVAHQQFIEGGNNRVILVTDGNISGDMSSANELAGLVRDEGNQGVKMSCMALGMDSVVDSELPVLARLGKGNFGCIHDACQAEKLLSGELEPQLSTVAEQVLVTAGFDTALVQEYRLIGFDNQRGSAADSVAGLKGSSIVSGHSVLALFELLPKKDTLLREAVAGVTIHYNLPGQSAGLLSDYHCPNHPVPFEKADAEWRKAVCVALFGMKLKAGDYATHVSWADLEKITKKAFSGNGYLEREYMALVSKARKVYEHQGGVVRAE